MKRIIPLILLLFCLCGCTGTTPAKPQPPATEPPTVSTMSPPSTEPSAGSDASTEPPAEPVFPSSATSSTEGDPETMQQNSAYTAWAREDAEPALGVMLNEPFSQAPEATVTWLEGEYDRAYIIPRYIGSYVNLFGVTWDDEGNYTIADKASQSTLVEDGTVIYSALFRPDGQPQWYLSVDAPDGQSFGMLLSYNGRYGSPTVEYLADACPASQAEALLAAALEGTYSLVPEEERTLIDGVPYRNYCVVASDGQQDILCNALISPDGQTILAATLNPETDHWEVSGPLASLLS